jgi:hypothetical protein
MKQYIILQDTLGDGLQIFPNLEVDPIEEKDLEEAVIACAEYLMEDYGHESVHDYETIADGTLDPGTSINIGQEIVICEILNEIDGISWDEWVRNKIVESKLKTNEQEFDGK